MPKTFLNQDYCTPSRACSPITYRAANVVLNHSTLRALHEGTGAYVYAGPAAYGCLVPWPDSIVPL